MLRRYQPFAGHAILAVIQLNADPVPSESRGLLTMRSADENGFGQKVRDWNRAEMVERWRARWAEHVNKRLAELDIDARIDHRSLEAQGIGLEPQRQVGAPAQRIEGEGIEAADRADMHCGIACNNGARIIADPSVALDAITHQQSTFTRRKRLSGKTRTSRTAIRWPHGFIG